MTATLWDDHPGLDAFHAQIVGHREWHTVADKAMRHLAESGSPFSADDLREILSNAGIDEPTTPNAYGGLFISWSKQGLIVRVGDGTSRGRKRNGGRRGLWIGIQHAEEVA